MKKTLSSLLLFVGLTVSACSPQLTAAPLPVTVEATQVPESDSSAVKSYSNSAFGLGFNFPASWYGPEEYVSDDNLRVEVGSDRVYPYGTDPVERIYDSKNSYNVVFQYSRNNQNQDWMNTYQSLLGLQDGESLSDGRGLVIRVRQLNVGGFNGVEYISTLSESAQTEVVYMRQVVLVNEQSGSLLTVMGQPINVEVGDGAEWGTVYRKIDEENLAFFHEMLDSITVNATGVFELDRIIGAALHGGTDELKSLMKFAQVECTVAEGLGGPPKCMEGEQAGTVVEVFPILDIEGHFLRKADLASWNGLNVSALAAVYEVSNSAYSDDNYPAGQYAIAFIGADENTSVTLQVDQGNIIRMDYGYESPLFIPGENVVRYLIEPKANL